jgi:hypothetical protein
MRTMKLLSGDLFNSDLRLKHTSLAVDLASEMLYYVDGIRVFIEGSHSSSPNPKILERR